MLRARSYRFRKLSARPSHGQTMTARNRMAVNSALLTDAQNQIRSSGHLDQRIWRIPGFFLFPNGLSPQRYGGKADPSRVAFRIGGSDAGFVLRRDGEDILEVARPNARSSVGGYGAPACAGTTMERPARPYQSTIRKRGSVKPSAGWSS